jgi:23S rRNA (adenine-N6)-dimethyltransferase
VAGRRRRPSNRPGAHYLSDPRTAAELITAARVQPGDLVLEFGAGSGALTAPLARRGARVIAIENEARLAARLRRRVGGTNVLVLEQDALEVSLPRRPYRVVANIPFAITTPLLGRLLDHPRATLRAGALVLQWEAARRLTGTRPANARILWWSARFELRILRRISASSFNPPPAVDAAAVVVEPRRSALVAPRHHGVFLSLLTHALADRRAPLRHALAPIFSHRQLHRLMRQLGTDPNDAVGSLTVEQWAAVNSVMVAVVDSSSWPRRKPRWGRRHEAR